MEQLATCLVEICAFRSSGSHYDHYTKNTIIWVISKSGCDYSRLLRLFILGSIIPDYSRLFPIIPDYSRLFIFQLTGDYLRLFSVLLKCDYYDYLTTIIYDYSFAVRLLRLLRLFTIIYDYYDYLRLFTIILWSCDYFDYLLCV